MWSWNRPVWRAWSYLSRSRTIGFGEGPVPISEMEAFLRVRHPGATVDERMEFLEVMTSIDGKYFEIKRALEPPKEA